MPVDCEPAMLNVTAACLAKRLEKIKMRALFVTNALGFTGDLDNIRTICRERNILLLEDNCESLGTELGGEKAGNFGLADFRAFIRLVINIGVPRQAWHAHA